MSGSVINLPFLPKSKEFVHVITREIQYLQYARPVVPRLMSNLQAAEFATLDYLQLQASDENQEMTTSIQLAWRTHLCNPILYRDSRNSKSMKS